MIHLRADSPMRPVDWRWERATLLRRHGRAASRLADDDLVARAKRYQAERERCGDEFDLENLRLRWPDLFDAHEIYLLQGDPIRDELEARLLSHAPLDGVARRTGLKPDVVRWYELLFFNVLDRMDNPSWVTHRAISPTLRDVGERDHAVVWKLMAYAGGEHVLDAVVSQMVNPVRPDAADGVRGFFAAQTRGVVDRRGYLGMLTLRGNDPYVKTTVAELQATYANLEKLAGTASTSDEIRDHLAAAMRAMPWGVGADGRAPVRVVTVGPSGDAERRAAEPRAVELLAARAGVATPDLAAAEKLTFPEGKP